MSKIIFELFSCTGMLFFPIIASADALQEAYDRGYADGLAASTVFGRSAATVHLGTDVPNAPLVPGTTFIPVPPGGAWAVMPNRSYEGFLEKLGKPYMEGSGIISNQGASQ